MAIGKPLWSLANLNFQLKQLKSSTTVLRSVGYLTLHNGIWKNVISIRSRNPLPKNQKFQSQPDISPVYMEKSWYATWMIWKSRYLTMGFSCRVNPNRSSHGSGPWGSQIFAWAPQMPVRTLPMDRIPWDCRVWYIYRSMTWLGF